MKLKPYDRVLVRNYSVEPWEADLFAREDVDEDGDIEYRTLTGYYSNCIPYEKNERLLGKTDEPEPELQFGDHVQVKYDSDIYWRNALFVSYVETSDIYIYRCIPEGGTNCTNYRYCRKADW